MQSANVWKNSALYIENFIDDPLTNKGISESYQTGTKLIKTD